ncbi:hypothetical protein R3P38DRAFT_2982681 [Favolaschia claudopus]|uniref:Uncharacterized protein n=1 Tax=Favolaschia claudopus TaxID=2862362 RepID=A0AAW0AY79_9AGAR
MSSGDAELFAFRDVYVNMTLLQAFGNGIYTVIFFLALYAMVFKRRTPRPLFAAVVIMYISAVIQTGVHWANTRKAFTYGNTPEETAALLAQPGFTMVVLPTTLLVANTVLADCVLIFRCYAVWNRDWRIIALPIMSTITSTVLGIMTIVETANFFKHGGDPNSFVDYARPYFGMCLCTTLLATLLIVFRIVWLTRYQTGPAAFSGYHAVIEMVVESAVLYSLTLIVYIVLLFGPDDSNNDGYAQAILIQMTGIAPTLIVARVSFGLARPSSSWQRTTSRTTRESGFVFGSTFTKQIQFSGNRDIESSFGASDSAIEMKRSETSSSA